MLLENNASKRLLPMSDNIHTSPVHSKSIDGLSPLELLKQEIRTERMEIIPVGRIVLDACIVDDSHVGSLAESMSSDRGQISPITVRARMEMGQDEKIYYDVIDGFHRSAGLVALQKEIAKATVIYGCGNEELFDLRVLAANSVRSVQFARVANWMQFSFSQTEWAKKDLTLSQVFSLVVFNSNGSKLGLTTDEAERLKRWVKDKAKTWNKPVPTIWEEMRSVEKAAPDLVAIVRVGGGGHGKKGVLSPARFMAVVDELPDEYELQRRVVQVVLANNLVEKQARTYAKAIAQLKGDEESLEEVFTGDPLETIAAINEEEIAKEARPGTAVANVRMQPEVSLVYPDATNNGNGTKLYNKKIEELVAQRPDDEVFWWRSYSALTTNEKIALKMTFDEGEDFERIADRLGVTANQVFALLKSGIRRYQLYRSEVQELSNCLQIAHINQ